MAEVRLLAETRTEFGKGGARRTRRAGKVPAVIYGHGADPRHVALPAREFANAIRHGGSNVLLTLDVDGGEQLAIPKAIQRHPIKGHFEHVDLLAVRRGEKVTIDVPITVVGDIVPGGLLNQEAPTHQRRGRGDPPADRLRGQHHRARDRHPDHRRLGGPAGGLARWPATRTLVLVIIAEAPTEAEIEAEMAEAAEELGIVEDQSDADTRPPRPRPRPPRARAATRRVHAADSAE